MPRIAQTGARKVWSSGRAGIICVLGGIVGACSPGGEPDCESRETIALVEKMAKDMDNPGPMESYGLDYAVEKVGCRFYSSCKKAVEEPHEFEKFRTEGMEKFKAEAVYKISSARLQSKDPTTKSVMCEADLIVEMPNHSSYASITYKFGIGTLGKFDTTILDIK